MEKKERKAKKDEEGDDYDEDDDDETFDFQGELYDLEDVASVGGGAFRNEKNTRAFNNRSLDREEGRGLE
jgi:hypothetical protein